MTKREAAADNARKHGIFAQDNRADRPSALADHAMSVISGPFGAEMAIELKRAEVQNARCQAVSLDVIASLENFLADTPFLSDRNIDRFLTELSSVRRLLRYQNDALSDVRKSRIKVLNALEGFDPLHRKSKKQL